MIANVALYNRIRHTRGGRLKLRTVDNPAGVIGGVALVVDEDEAAVDVLQLHQNHGTGTVIAPTWDEPFAM